MECSDELDSRELNRLRWRCRRGMRELDELLQPFLRNCLTALSKDELRVFNEILNCQDQKLLNYLLLTEAPEDQGWVDVITRIRTSITD